MVFSIVTTLLVIGIAYFHLVQGLFSGIISVVLALLAGTLAVGYHESIVTGVLGGKMADSANGMTICIIFAAVYGIGRVLFDSLVPGNVRLPYMVDVIGGTGCGVIVGLCAAGTLALAMQSMPFGPTILMHSRYALADDREVTVNGARRQESALLTGALDMEGDRSVPDESKLQGLWIPADSMLIDYTAYQSEAGALAGSTKLRDRHPKWLDELFFGRLGMENSAKRTALNIGSKTDITMTKLFAMPTALLQMDGENPSLSRGRKLTKSTDPKKLVLVVRIDVQKGAADADGRFRFSPGAIRMVVDGKDFTPTGVLYAPGRVNLLMNYRVDDFLVAELSKDGATAGIDLVFVVDRTDVLQDANAKDGLKIKAAAFLEVKRLARVDLTDKDVPTRLPDVSTDDGMLFKKEALLAIQTRLAETGDAAQK